MMIIGAMVMVMTIMTMKKRSTLVVTVCLWSW